MKALVRPILLIASVGIAVGAVAGVLLVTRGTSTTESTGTILRKYGEAQRRLLAPLGPNSTYHVITVTHKERTIGDASDFAEPADATTEGFMTFDSDGMLHSYWQVSRGPDGEIFSRSHWADEMLVTTYTGRNVTSRSPYPRQDAKALAQSLDASARGFIDNRSSAKAGTATIAGVSAYVIETQTNRLYIAKSDYRVLKSEDVAPDGHVTEYTILKVQEVLPGIATSTP